MRNKELRFPNKLLIFGVLFVLLGIGLLIMTLGYLSVFDIFWPIFIIFLGMSVLYLTYLRGHKDLYIFPGVILVISGIFVLLKNVFPDHIDPGRIWPVFMLFIGISVILYSIRKQEGKRHTLFVPGVSIIFLSLVFLLFSLGFIKTGFIEIVFAWWPVLIILLGAGLLISYFTGLGKNKKS